MVVFMLDRTGVLTSDKMEFAVHSHPLILKPLEPVRATQAAPRRQLGELFD
jgi:hypothetical protein